MEANEIISSGLLELYAAGLASVEEARQVQIWIKQYPEVARELNAIEENIEAFAQANAIPPGASVKTKLFQKISSEEKPASPLVAETGGTVRHMDVWRWVAAASIILLVGSLAMNIRLYRQSNRVDNHLHQMQQEFASLQEKHMAMEKDMSIIHDKYAMAVPLHGLEAAPSAAAKIIWMQNTGEVYIDAANLPETPAGKQYQLWAIVDGKPVDAGMIDMNKDNKNRMQKMKVFPKADAFAVTLESEAGNASPKGPMYVMGKV